MSIISSEVGRYARHYIQVPLGVAQHFFGQGLELRRIGQISHTLLDGRNLASLALDHLLQQKFQAGVVEAGKIAGKRPGLRLAARCENGLGDATGQRVLIGHQARQGCLGLGMAAVGPGLGVFQDTSAASGRVFAAADSGPSWQPVLQAKLCSWA